MQFVKCYTFCIAILDKLFRKIGNTHLVVSVLFLDLCAMEFVKHYLLYCYILHTKINYSEIFETFI
jgi:hypothetical protein